MKIFRQKKQEMTTLGPLSFRLSSSPQQSGEESFRQKKAYVLYPFIKRPWTVATPHFYQGL